VASPQRKGDERRIRRATRGLLYGSLGATAVFGGLAANATHAQTNTPAAASNSSEQTSGESSDDFFQGSAPQTSTSPPVAQSGGS
jgi:hypothetical protein